MNPHGLLIVYLVSVVVAAGVWVWINLSSAIKNNLGYVIEPVASGEGRPGNGSCRALGTLPGVAGAVLPGVAILSPGRDEADHLPRTLAKLCEQDDANYRVVFVDDASADATPTVTAAMMAKYPHLSVLRLEGDPPAGWVGKCWALHRGYEYLQQLEQQDGRRAEVIIFTDADIDWQPNVLTTVRQIMREHKPGVISLFPNLEFGSAGEAIVQMQVMLALGILFPMDKAVDPNHHDTIVAGAFILVRRSYYDQIEGHRSVRNEMVDDVNLGRKLKAAGARMYLGHAPKLLSARMYDSFADQWEGFTKNIYAGLEHRWWKAVALIVGALLINVLPIFYVLIAMVWCYQARSLLSAFAFGLSLLTVLMQVRAMNVVRTLVNLPRRYAWSLPIGSAIVMAMTFVSALHYYTGGNRWKGRTFRAESK